jgi:hypothetical protein
MSVVLRRCISIAPEYPTIGDATDCGKNEKAMKGRAKE